MPNNSDNQDDKIYLYSLRFYILFSFCVFIFAVFLGWFTAKILPEESQNVLKELQESFEPINELGSLGQCLYIFFNNTTSAIFTILLGLVLGIFPFLSLFSNGEVLGMLAFSLRETISPAIFFVGILPHGIFEIPVLIIAGAMGLKIGKLTINKFFSKKEVDFKKEISRSFNFFFKFLFPLLAVAALVEVFVTPHILNQLI